ncbi:MAG: hypothetical protein WBF29_06425 [Syntrophobacteria bacterium]
MVLCTSWHGAKSILRPFDELPGTRRQAQGKLARDRQGRQAPRDYARDRQDR